MIVDISALAREDLIDIRNFWIAQYGREAADNYLDSLLRATDTLEAFPLAGRAMSEINEHLRRFGHSPHVLIYSIGDEVIRIERVLHEKSDIYRQLEYFRI